MIKRQIPTKPRNKLRHILVLENIGDFIHYHDKLHGNDDDTTGQI